MDTKKKELEKNVLKRCCNSYLVMLYSWSPLYMVNNILFTLVYGDGEYTNTELASNTQ
ncbi:hypothetical protein CKC_05815 [Candidatus Liberibacter solanacearum CLso-ZC1]|uniref:Uncharacterized protein n=1 Tax=Liberibacter solanacearum (strain CLso-ZC1) TaxID=658172 RepID=E4UE80_LIBSC|nr:hypothetical protein CKC_05815 [Candidatus Liberibacter solanacearum CLso-ZC1]